MFRNQQNERASWWCKRKSHKMLNHTQTICLHQPTNCLSVFDHFKGCWNSGKRKRNQQIHHVFRRYQEYRQNLSHCKFPCKLWNKAVANNHHVIQCDKSHSWIHVKCNKINWSTYRYLQQYVYAWYCTNALKILFHSPVSQIMIYMRLTLVKNKLQNIIEKLK